MSEREPMVFDFSHREALLMGRACTKAFDVGQRVGGINIAAARRMEAAGLVTIVEDRYDKFIMKPTKLGREAWTNQGRRAAGRPLVRLTG